MITKKQKKIHSSSESRVKWNLVGFVLTCRELLPHNWFLSKTDFNANKLNENVCGNEVRELRLIFRRCSRISIPIAKLRKKIPTLLPPNIFSLSKLNVFFTTHPSQFAIWMLHSEHSSCWWKCSIDWIQARPVEALDIVWHLEYATNYGLAIDHRKIK